MAGGSVDGGTAGNGLYSEGAEEDGKEEIRDGEEEVVKEVREELVENHR